MPCLSEEGAQHGDGPPTAGLRVGVRPEVPAVGIELALHCGASRFLMDDVGSRPTTNSS